jgi:starch synthase
VKLISYGVDLISRFFPTNRPSDHTFDVLYVGAVSIRKGIPYLFTAFELLEHPNKRLTIVGSLTPELKDKVRAFASSRKNIRVQPCACHDIAQRRRGLGPCAGSSNGLRLSRYRHDQYRAEDLFTNGVEGFIVGIRDPDAIAGCLQKLADDRQLRNRMGAAALARVREIGVGIDTVSRCINFSAI